MSNPSDQAPRAAERRERVRPLKRATRAAPRSTPRRAPPGSAIEARATTKMLGGLKVPPVKAQKRSGRLKATAGRCSGVSGGPRGARQYSAACRAKPLRRRAEIRGWVVPSAAIWAGEELGLRRLNRRRRWDAEMSPFGVPPRTAGGAAPTTTEVEERQAEQQRKETRDARVMAVANLGRATVRAEDLTGLDDRGGLIQCFAGGVEIRGAHTELDSADSLRPEPVGANRVLVEDERLDSKGFELRLRDVRGLNIRIARDNFQQGSQGRLTDGRSLAAARAGYHQSRSSMRAGRAEARGRQLQRRVRRRADSKWHSVYGSGVATRMPSQQESPPRAPRWLSEGTCRREAARIG